MTNCLNSNSPPVHSPLRSPLAFAAGPCDLKRVNTNASPSSSTSGGGGGGGGSSSLRRSEGIMNLDQASLGSPIAKKYPCGDTTCLPLSNLSFSANDAPPATSNTLNRRHHFQSSKDPRKGPPSANLRSASNRPPSSSSSDQLFSPILLQHNTNIPQPSFLTTSRHFDLGTPGNPLAKIRKTVSVENNLNIDNASPFGIPAPLPNSSAHSSSNGVPAHPLSFSVKPPANEDRFPLVTHKEMMGGPKPIVNPRIPALSSQSTKYVTPPSFRLVRPLQTAFMSTGLISKRNRPASPLDPERSVRPPETPCKRPTYNNTSSSTNNNNNTKNRFTPSINDTAAQYDNINNYRNPSIRNYDDNPFDLPPTPTKKPTSSLLERRKLIPSSVTLPSSCTWCNNDSTSNVVIGELPSSDGAASVDSTCSSSSRSDNIQASQSLTEFGMSALPPMTPAKLPKTPSDSSFFFRTNVNSSGGGANSSEGRINMPNISGGGDNNNNSNTKNTTGGDADMHTDTLLNSMYQSVSILGIGEFSVVYNAVERQAPHNRVAIKRTKHPFVGPKERRRRMEEVDILRHLSSQQDDESGRDYVINLIDAWESKRFLYIATEFCDNGSLEVFLNENGRIARLDEWRVWKILVEVALGLRYIHDQGFIHLDIKPANIFITFEGTLKIGDFGMATKLPASSDSEREGDREYIAPEVLKRQEYDKPADIFSLGLVMLEIAANIVLPDNGVSWQKLRSGDLSDAGRLSSGDLDSIMVQDDDKNNNNTSNVSSPPSWAPKFMIDESGPLDRIVKWMLQPQPQDRPNIHKVLEQPEIQFVEKLRKQGAVIFEGDYGPTPADDCQLSQDMLMDFDNDKPTTWRVAV